MDDDDDDDYVMPKKMAEEGEMDITPMIDVVFLLLIFFVVCSTMDPVKIGEIPDAQNGLPVSAKESAVIFVKSAGGDKVNVIRGDGREFSTDEATQETEIIEYITAELEKSIGDNKNQVMIMGDASVKVLEITRIQKVIGDAFEDIDRTYIGVKED
ncbi:ExbD/TolR family protein [Planctomycetes bacterium K23_9]|uniref:Biopolymer transport protein ExbD/TolR n=1 Tax=Stieleria marina TaxID=1930275 RepID=A0A517NNM7_9BACT|nr:Biopolymer transport protein ExbD/TolR [Planctomycetes bacterium K23_9]